MSQLDKPQQWATGGDAPTEKQKAFLETLAKDKGVDVDPSNINKGDASAKIDELKNMNTANPGATAGEPIRDPNSWATGGDPASDKQKGYIAVMAKQAGQEPPQGDMGKTEASQKIGELKEKTGM
ncbi:hypothetical protein LTR85_004396 [Meristemomyces frigidus]|nr:hypothetical protein LTR85_004396 [Meristemomyces frigidus]